MPPDRNVYDPSTHIVRALPLANLTTSTLEDFDFERDGNAGTIMAYGTDILQRLDLGALRNEFRLRCMKGTYEDLLATFDQWFTTDLLDQYNEGRDAS